MVHSDYKAAYDAAFEVGCTLSIAYTPSKKITIHKAEPEEEEVLGSEDTQFVVYIIKPSK